LQVVPPEKQNVTSAEPGSCQIGGNEFAAACDLPRETACYPSRRYITYLSVKTKGLTVDGPVDLIQGGEKFILRHPIFVDTTGAAYNATFGRSYGPANCTSTECYSEATGVRYWGMSDSLLTFKRCAPVWHAWRCRQLGGRLEAVCMGLGRRASDAVAVI